MKRLIKLGYDVTMWYATSLDSIKWYEKGHALAKGEVSEWDHGSVFTLKILVAEGYPRHGAHRPEAFTDSREGEAIQWGVEIGTSRQLLFLERFDLIG